MAVKTNEQGNTNADIRELFRRVNDFASVTASFSAANTQTSVAHALGRPPVGWQVLRVNKDAGIYSDAATSDPGGAGYLSALRILNDGNATGMADMDDDCAAIDFSGWTDATGNMIFDNTVRVRVAGSSKYLVFSSAENTLTNTVTLASQTTENNFYNLTYTTDSTYITGTDMTYSGGRGSAALKIAGTWTGAAGGYSNIYSSVSTSGALSAAGSGVIGIKSVVTNTGALTDGSIYGGMFIAKHNHATSTMTAQAALVGLEGWAYLADAGQVGTALGGNFAIHNESTGSAISGSVHRVMQLVCDNAAGANKATESSGLCIWNMAGTWDNAINVVVSGSGFTNFALFTDDGTPAQSTSTTVTNTGSKGWIKVKVGTATRYIALGDGVT